MIHTWLLKHRWVNEIGKIIVGGVMVFFAVGFYTMELVIPSLSSNIYKYTMFAFSATAAGCLLIDAAVSIRYMLTNKTGPEDK